MSMSVSDVWVWGNADGESMGMGKDKPMLDLHLGVFVSISGLAMPSADSDCLTWRLAGKQDPLFSTATCWGDKVRGSAEVPNSNRPQCGATVERLFIAIGNLFWDNRLHTWRLLGRQTGLGPHSPATCPSPGLCHEPGKKDGDLNSISETRITIGNWKRPTVLFVPCRTLWRRNGPGRTPPLLSSSPSPLTGALPLTSSRTIID